MRPLLALFILGALAVCELSAQHLWTPEIGVRGGYARFKLTGTSAADHTDLVDLPGFGSGYGSLFVVIPVGRRIAIEPSVALSQVSAGEPTLFFVSNTNVALGLRGDYALTPHVYAAFGGRLIYSESGGQHDMQFGAQAAIGYRTPLSARISARLEAEMSTMARGSRDNLQPSNLYALLVGLSARSGSAAGRRVVAAGRWAPVLGVAAGYSRAHLSGAGLTIDFTLLAAPGSVAAAGVSAPPTLFAIVPLTERLAFEPGFDIHRTQSLGTTNFSGMILTRLDYAVGPHWYAAAGPAMHIIKNTGSSAFGVAGFGVAWGSRFHLAGDLGGRVELNYTMFKERSGLPFAANTLGVMFGAMMPLR
ncbi:MAG: hypothetical protein HYS40_00895 [Gemmatimonadetes bacterium]|nr:hypothetical protein [Gemmatimonadota bacterium]